MTNKRLMPIAFLCLLLAACSPNVTTRGHVKDPEWKESITEGVSTRDDVLAALGSPSTRSSFGEETWYYITTIREQHAFLKPDVTDQHVLSVSFTLDGTVSGIMEANGDDLREVAVTERITPTEGHQLTFIEQLLGNVGRFNTPDSGQIGVGSNRPGGR